MKQHKTIAAMAVVFAMVALLLPMSASADTFSGTMALQNGAGYTYKSWSRGYLPAFEMKVTLNSTLLKLDDYQTYGYCVDLAQDTGDGNYGVTLTTLDQFADKYYKIAWLMREFGPVTGTGEPEEDYKAVALQSLIWSTLTGNNGYQPSPWSEPSAGYWYNQYYQALTTQLNLTNELKADLSKEFMVAVSAKKQDFMVRVPGGGGEVPEPATVVLLGTGLLGLAVLRFKKRG